MASMAFPRLRVQIDGDEMRELVVQTDNRDAIRFDLLRARKAWPLMSDAPILWMTVIAWSAIQRSDKTFVSADVETALDEIVAVEPVDEDGNAVDMAEAMVQPVPTIPAQ